MKANDRVAFLPHHGSTDIDRGAVEQMKRFGIESCRNRKSRHERSARYSEEFPTKAGLKIDASAGRERTPSEVSIGRLIFLRATAPVCLEEFAARIMSNQSPEPTSPAVTIPAGAGLAPSGAVAHL
jgi:hypothetical protein